MNVLQAHLDFLADHPLGVVFVATLLEGAGVPMPSRLILIITPAFLASDADLVWLIAVAAVGAVLGDHVPYLAGRAGGARVLSLYCKVTLASEQCVERTLQYFLRFGSAALLAGRFSASVRVFASACAGCGHISYARFLALDAVGTLVYTTLWVLVGHLIGERAVEFFTTDRRRFLVMGLGLAGLVGLIVYRLWSRRSHGAAQPVHLETGSAAALRDEVHPPR